MDNGTKKILSLITINGHETEKKSANMEKACFLRAMGDLAEKGVLFLKWSLTLTYKSEQ